MKKTIGSLILIIAFIVGAFIGTISKEENSEILDESTQFNTSIFVDSKTNINYIIVYNYNGGISITPRLDNNSNNKYYESKGN